MNVFDSIGAFFTHSAKIIQNKLTAAQKVLAPVESQVGTIAEHVLETALGEGLKAVVETPPESLSLSNIEKTTILAGRAIVKSAGDQGTTILPQLALTLAGALHTEAPVAVQ